MAQEIRTAESLIAEAVAAFEKRFGSKPTVGAKAPGRVNLIGEHTDYNEGFVFPMVSSLILTESERVLKGDRHEFQGTKDDDVNDIRIVKQWLLFTFMRLLNFFSIRHKAILF